MPENETHWRTHRTSEECALLKKKVSTTSLTKKYKKSNKLQNSLHVFKIYYRYWEDKKVNSFLIWLSHILSYNIFTTLICKINKSIKEFVEFINDLSITCSTWSTQVFGWYLCRIQYKKNYFFFKKSLTLLCSLCKLYHKNDCHLFDEYKKKKRQCRPLSGHSHTQGQRFFLCFFKNTLTNSLTRQVVAAVIHKNLTLTMFLTSKETLPTGNLLKHTWKTHFKTLAEHWKFQINLCKLLRIPPPS